MSMVKNVSLHKRKIEQGQKHFELVGGLGNFGENMGNIVKVLSCT